MIDIEKQLLDNRKSDVKNINEDEFLYKLEMRVRHSKDNRRTVIYSFMMLIVLSILTISQYDNPVTLYSTNYVDETENIFETDLWNIDIYSLDYDSLYLYDMAYILLEEGYLWEAYELISVSKSQKRNL
tara:strand:- start:42 stop:428 length:387 start_codon:yes stop_codon:yes gene_type:complete